MNEESLTAALDSCGGDVLLAVQQLSGLHLDAQLPVQNGGEPLCNANNADATHVHARVQAHTQQPTASPSAQPFDAPTSASDWVELFVQQMAASNSLDDARVRAGGLLGAFEQFLSSQKPVQAENAIAQLNAQLETVSKENAILKKAVTIQHSKNLELHEALKATEMKNYSLTVHLKQMNTNSGSTIMNHHVC